MYQLLTNILNGSDEFPDTLEYDHFYLLRMPKYIQASNSKGYAALEGKRPGDDVIEVRSFHANNTHMYLNSVDEYERRAKRKTRKKVKGEDVNIELFERYRAKGIKYVHQMMLANKLL